MSIESVMPSNHLILCHPLLLLPSIFPSIRIFSKESVLYIRWPKYQSFSFSISPSNEYSGLISIKITGLISSQSKGPSRVFSNTAVQKASILQFSAFFIVQLSYPYMTTGNTIALTRRTLAGKVMPLLFNKLSSLVIAFLPRSKHLLISRLQSPSPVILEPRKIKVLHRFHCFPIYLPWSDGTGCHELSFLNVEFKPTVSLPLSLSSRGSLVLLCLCHKGGVICISEVIDISPGNPDYSLFFIHSGISHDILLI